MSIPISAILAMLNGRGDGTTIPTPVAASPPPVLPPWRQKLKDAADRVFSNVGGGPNPYLSAPEQQFANRQRNSAIGLSLLQSSGPRPVGTGSMLSDLGNALGAGQQASGAAADQSMQARLQQMQMRMLQQQMKQYGPQRPTIGAPNPETFTSESLSDYLRTGDPRVLSLRPKEQKAPEVGPDAAKLQAIEGYLGRKLNDKEAFTVIGAGELFKAPAGDDLDKPLSPTDLTRLRLPNGATLPFGTTSRQAMQSGAKAFSEADLTRQANISGAMNTLTELKSMALGKDGVFRDNGGSVVTNNRLARLANGFSNGMGALFGTDASMRREVFNATSQGSISSLVRAMGEAGSLSDGDVKRALSLIPSLGAAPATEAQAKIQFEELEKIIGKGAQNLSSTSDSGQSKDPLGIR